MTLKISRAGKLHKVIGYGFIFLGFLACMFGIHTFIELYGSESLGFLGILNGVLTFAIYTAIECCHRRKRFGKDLFVAPNKQ